MDSHIIENIPRIAQFIGKESYLTPFIGSLYAALHGMGTPRYYAELLALSGAGNRLTWRPDEWFGGNCDILACEEPPFAPHLRVLKAIGLTAKIRLFKEIVGLKGPYDTMDHAREEITASIEKGIPVIAMGIIGPPECCVVHGFEKVAAHLSAGTISRTAKAFHPNSLSKRKIGRRICLDIFFWKRLMQFQASGKAHWLPSVPSQAMQGNTRSGVRGWALPPGRKCFASWITTISPH